jgi:hypothetical protein
MKLLLLAAFGTRLLVVKAQEAWGTPCQSYCFPQNQQGAVELQGYGFCPPAASIVVASDTYYTPTCACYDYYTADGSQ